MFLNEPGFLTQVKLNIGEFSFETALVNHWFMLQLFCSFIGSAVGPSLASYQAYGATALPSFDNDKDAPFVMDRVKDKSPFSVCSLIHFRILMLLLIFFIRELPGALFSYLLLL
jgi:hypothetical protein